MEEEKLYLSNYLKIGVDMEQGVITPDEAEVQFHQFFEKLIIKKYMKHKDKILKLAGILFKMDNINDVTATASYLEMARVSQGLLSYCVNLVNDVEIPQELFVIYDAIVENGLYDHILQFCREDYQVFTGLLSDALNIARIQDLLNSFALFDEQDFTKWEQALRDLGNQLTPELLEGIVQLSMHNDAAIQELYENLSHLAAERASEDLKKALNNIPEEEQEKHDEQNIVEGEDKHGN